MPHPGCPFSTSSRRPRETAACRPTSCEPRDGAHPAFYDSASASIWSRRAPPRAREQRQTLAAGHDRSSLVPSSGSRRCRNRVRRARSSRTSCWTRCPQAPGRDARGWTARGLRGYRGSLASDRCRIRATPAPASRRARERRTEARGGARLTRVEGSPVDAEAGRVPRAPRRRARTRMAGRDQPARGRLECATPRRRLRRGFVDLHRLRATRARELYSHRRTAAGTLTTFARHTMSGPRIVSRDAPSWLRAAGRAGHHGTRRFPRASGRAAEAAEV